MSLSPLAIGAAVVFTGLAALALIPCGLIPGPCDRGSCSSVGTAVQADVKLVADCVEVRSASVFAGACHYNGELMTEGNEALLAVRVERGSAGGVDLAGVRAAALIASESNLKLGGERRSIVYVGEGASAEQRGAIVELLRERSHDGLGEVLAVESARVEVDSSATAYAVRIGERVELAGVPMPDRDCCKMPTMVWYEPLVPLKQRVVGSTSAWSVDEPRLGMDFRRTDENSAFLGRLSFFEGGCSAGSAAAPASLE